MVGWNSLLNELRLIILNDLFASEVPSFHRTRTFRRTYHQSSNAAVSRQLQWYFERKNFECLQIRQADLQDFGRIMTEERRLALRTLWLCVELTPYTCDKCHSEETNEEAAANNVTFTHALWNLFTTLSEWTATDRTDTKCPRLTLALSAYSPSDKDHHFRDHRFDDNCSMFFWDDPTVHHDPAHGWYSGTQVLPSQASRLRLLGKPLHFDFAQMETDTRNLPEIRFVHTLRIPRQFYRQIPELDIILKSLPRLQTFQYEPWKEVTSERDWEFVKGLGKLLAALPTSLKRLSVYQDSSESINQEIKYDSSVLTAFWLSSPRLSLWELNASFINDAEDFFRPFDTRYRPKKPSYSDPKCLASWRELRVLTMTTKLLGPRRHGQGQELDRFLRAVAAAVLRMPKLNNLELWYGRRQEGRIFRYTRTPAEILIEWRDMDNTPTSLSSQVIKAWQNVAKYKRRHFRFEYSGARSGLVGPCF
ncbi:putative F-box domain-containing protein [Seiridium unicorne]|uniref:F-box domain-containing protein n=1 Tax=Seiridium unicorne TaxID=138068 RepID=A0ABR2UXR1_9PEZI